VILDEILAHKRQEVATRRRRRRVETMTRLSPVPRGFASDLRQPGVSVIAEYKRKSPSGGDLLPPEVSPASVARLYAAHGAAAISVLTDMHYFGGSDADLREARAASALPVLRKDFVIDPYQVYEANALGADAVLLIVRALADSELRALLSLTRELGMDALVETHSADEVRRALDSGASVIGVNNRDLDTLETDVSVAPRLRPLVPRECLFVAESGVSSPEQIAILRDAEVDAVLIGESLLRAPDPSRKLAALVKAGAAHCLMGQRA
jgi:indole-3-glycerol phosphate synthase